MRSKPTVAHLIGALRVSGSFLILLTLAGVSAHAQKIAVVDMQTAIIQTKEGKVATEQLTTKFGSKETELRKRGEVLAAKQADLSKLNDAARADSEREIAAAQKTLQRDAEDLQNDVQTEETRLLGPILQKMRTVMGKYAQDKQISMIVDVSQQPNNLLFADKSLFVTTELIALYDKGAGVPAAAPAAAPKPPAANPPATKKPAGTTPTGK